jgi:type I restriction enzyme M protein
VAGEDSGALGGAAAQDRRVCSAPITEAVLSAVSERDETAAIRRDDQGNAEPDPELRDTESVPLTESVEAFFEREVKPDVPDAWIDTDKRDPKDGQVGIICGCCRR